MFVGRAAYTCTRMIVGREMRADDLDANATKEKKRRTCALHLGRAAAVPPRPAAAGPGAESTRDDERQGLTPKSVRLRKKDAFAQKRQSATSRSSRARPPA